MSSDRVHHCAMTASLLAVESRRTVLNFIVLGDVEHLLASSHGSLCSWQPVMQRCLPESRLSTPVARKLKSQKPQVGQKCVQHVGFPEPCQLRRCLTSPSSFSNCSMQLV